VAALAGAIHLTPAGAALAVSSGAITSGLGMAPGTARCLT